MLRKTGEKLIQRQIESLTDPEQREYGNRTSGLDHLPVTHTEAIGDHVLLGQLTLRSVGPNPVSQRPEEPRVMDRQVSAGTHISRVCIHEQKEHEQNCVLYVETTSCDPASWPRTTDDYARCPVDVAETRRARFRTGRIGETEPTAYSQNSRRRALLFTLPTPLSIPFGANAVPGDGEHLIVCEECPTRFVESGVVEWENVPGSPASEWASRCWCYEDT